ncbi:MAG: transposase [Planctomycetota bacterium]
MPRGERCCSGGPPFHVLNRRNNQRTPFHTPGDYEAFIRVAKETLLIVSMILADCLMPNHWRFVLWPEADRELSHFMRQLTTTHVRRWHKAHHGEGTGHVDQGPFKSFPVQGDDHLFMVCRC